MIKMQTLIFIFRTKLLKINKFEHYCRIKLPANINGRISYEGTKHSTNNEKPSYQSIEYFYDFSGKL